MHGHMRRAIFALMALVMGVIAVPQHASAANVPRGVEQQVAIVRVTIQQADGTTLRATRAVRWGDATSIDLGRHDLELAVNDREHLVVLYTRDGDTVADTQLDARRKVIVHADEASKLTVHVIPTKVRVESTPL